MLTGVCESLAEGMLVQQEPQEQTCGDEDEAEQVEEEHDQADRIEPAEPMRRQAQGEGNTTSGHAVSEVSC